MAQWLRTLNGLLKVLSSNPTTTWWLTTTRNEIWCPLLVCSKTATVYLCVILNKSLKKKKKEEDWLAGRGGACL